MRMGRGLLQQDINVTAPFSLPTAGTANRSRPGMSEHPGPGAPERFVAWCEEKNPASRSIARRGFCYDTVRLLPTVVRECLVGLGHPVRVFLLLDRVALALARGNDFGGELVGHGLLVAAA